MSQRLIRDCTDSDKINKISREAECFFYRLMMKADDYGNYHGDPLLLKSALYPLLINITIEDVSGWIKECEAVRGRIEDGGLVISYLSNGKTYLHIVNFGQRLRQAKKRFPDPPADICQPLAVNSLSTRGQSPPEVEVELEVEIEENKKVVFESLKNYFGFGSEMLHISKWSEIMAFLNNLQKSGKLVIFSKTFEFYKNYKAATGEKIHSFGNFINDGWNAENWEHKLNEFKKIPVNGKIPPTSTIYIPINKPKGISEERTLALLRADRERLEKLAENYKPGPEQPPSDNSLGSRMRKQLDKIAPKS